MFGFNLDKKSIYIFIGIIVVLTIVSAGIGELYYLVLSVPGVLLALTVHEFGHAFAAYKLGDDTPVRQGRLSLNPFDHIEPLGIAMLLFAHIGWGKPVQVDPRNYNRNISVEKADAIVSLAGPLMNFITAIIFALIYCALLRFLPILVINDIGQIIIEIIIAIVSINIGLGVFNMIPLPPLDGSKIFLPVLPRNAKIWFIQHEQLFYIVFLVMWITGIAGEIIAPIVNQIGYAVLNLASMIFGLR